MAGKFPNVELARIGKFDASTGPVELTTQDFDDIQAAYESLKGKVLIPIKLGHDDEQAALTESGLPAAGWVENVRRLGDKLIADLVNIPDPVVALIKSGALRTRSIEAVRNVTLAGKKWKFALTGLALLGAELPAVDSLEDIAALYASGRVAAAGELDSTEIVVIKMTATTEDDPEAMIEELRALIGRIAQTTAGKRGAPRLRQLLSVAVDELKSVPKPTVRGSKTGNEDDMDIAKFRTKLGLADTATEDEVLAALDQWEPKKTSDDTNSEVEAMKAELTKTRTDLIKLQNARTTDIVTGKVDDAIKARRFVPASRDSLIKLALADETAFDELLKGTPENVVLGAERGTSTNQDGIPTELEPTETELKVAAQIGVTREDLIRSKAAAAGITLPTKKEEVKV